MKQHFVFLLFLASIWKVQAQDVNARMEMAAPTKLDTISESAMLANPQFKRLAGKEWKLDQMFVDSLPVPSSEIVNKKVFFVAPKPPSTPRKFLWVSSTVNDTVKGKDYPLKVLFDIQYGLATISSLKLFHKYQSNVLLYTYAVTYLSDKILVLISKEKDSKDAGMTHTVEYRFLASP